MVLPSVHLSGQQFSPAGFPSCFPHCRGRPGGPGYACIEASPAAVGLAIALLLLLIIPCVIGRAGSFLACPLLASVPIALWHSFGRRGEALLHRLLNELSEMRTLVSRHDDEMVAARQRLVEASSQKGALHHDRSVQDDYIEDILKQLALAEGDRDLFLRRLQQMEQANEDAQSLRVRAPLAARSTSRTFLVFKCTLIKLMPLPSYLLATHIDYS